ncbi:MAG: TolC family protein [Cyclobacteriaceae bacterium]
MRHRLLAIVFFLFSGFHFAFGQEEISLEQVVALALEKNYDVQILKKASEAAQTDKSYSWAAFLPQINASGARLWNENDQKLRVRDRATDDIVTIEGDIASNNMNASGQLVWTLFDGTRMFSTRERLAVFAEQSQLAMKDQMVNTIADVIANYYDIVRQKQQLKAIQEQMSVSEERVKLAERKLQVGTGIKPELLQARVDYNAQRTQVLQQESTIAQLKQQLNALVGLQLPTQYEVADTIIIDLNLNPEDFTENFENTNFTLQAARQNIRMADLSLRERKAEYLPFFNFNASYNYTKTDNTRLINPYGTLLFQQNGYNYGFSVTLPILNGLNARRQSQQAKIEIDRQTLFYNQLKTNVNVGLKNAYVNYDNAKKILLIEEETIGLAKENIFIALESFKRGVTTFIELRTAQQSLAEAYSRLISARYNAKLAETELLRLNGSLLR